MDEEASLTALTLGSSHMLSFTASLKVKPTVHFYLLRRYLYVSISYPYKRFIRTIYCGTEDLIIILQHFMLSLIWCFSTLACDRL